VALAHLPVPERVVGDDQAALGQTRQDGLVVVDVTVLVGVDEDEVEVAVETRDCLKRGPDVQCDARAVGTAIEVALRERRPLLVDLARVDAAAVGQRRGHRERRMAAERADLEHALRPAEPDEQLEKAAGDRAGEHSLGAEPLTRLLGELGEQRLVRGGQAIGVVGELWIDNVHYRSTAEPPTIASWPSSKRTHALPLPS